MRTFLPRLAAGITFTEEILVAHFTWTSGLLPVGFFDGALRMPPGIRCGFVFGTVPGGRVGLEADPEPRLAPALGRELGPPEAPAVAVGLGGRLP